MSTDVKAYLVMAFCAAGMVAIPLLCAWMAGAYRDR